MLILLSPAKNMNFAPYARSAPPTEPRMLDDARALIRRARRMGAAEIKSLMELSDDLAKLNHERFQTFQDDPRPEGAKPALFTFAGDVYQGFDAQSLSDEGVQRAQDRLRILSGLYGVLRPLDLIQPYRLEMGRALDTDRGANLYDFWGSRIAARLNGDLDGHESRILVNLASKEYFGAVDRRTLDAQVVTPSFKDEKDGKLRALGFFAKRARGEMARWAVERDVRSLNDLKAFNGMGYAFRADLSSGDAWTFVRRQPEKKAA